MGKVALEGDLVFRHVDAGPHCFEGAAASVGFEGVVAENIHVGGVASAGEALGYGGGGYLFRRGPLCRSGLEVRGFYLPEIDMQSRKGFSMCCKIVLPWKSVMPRSPTPSIRMNNTFTAFFYLVFSI